MIAEIHGKISSYGTNLSDRMEDQLTGDVFGALRYVAVEHGLLPLLTSRFLDNPYVTAKLDALRTGAHVSFWKKYPEGEPDVMIFGEDIAICIEVKYKSGISSDDGADYSLVEEEDGGTVAPSDEVKSSKFQLTREANILLNHHAACACKLLVFVADELDCEYVLDDVVRARNLMPRGVTLVSLSWQEILRICEEQSGKADLPAEQKCALTDIVHLLKRKGFERFQGFRSGIDVTRDGLWELSFESKTKYGFHGASAVEWEENNDAD